LTLVPPNDFTQRNLVLLAKVLQNLANESEFGSKEPYMVKLNEFVTENISALHKFFDEIMVTYSDPSTDVVGLTKIPKNVRTNSLLYLHSYIHTNQVKVASALTDASPPDTDTANNLRDTLKAIGTPNVLKKH